MHELFVLASDESLDVSLTCFLLCGLMLYGLLNHDWSLQDSIEGIIDRGLGVAEGSCFRDEEEAGEGRG